MRVRFYLERNKAVRKEKTIWCYIREKSNGIYLNTNEKINEDYWDKEEQKANLRMVKDVSTKASLRDLNQFLTSYKNKVYEIARGIRIKEPNANFDEILIAIKKYFNKEQMTFFGLYEKFINNRGPILSKEAIQKHKRTKQLLLDFEKEQNKKIVFDAINNSFFERLFSFLLQRGMISNTANKTISFFKTFLFWAKDNEYTDKANFKSKQLSYHDNDVIYLTEDELMKLYEMDIENDRLKQVRDIFVFQCFVGARYSDIEKIDRSEIKNGFWSYRPKKTRGAEISIPLNQYSSSILQKYRDLDRPLPIISNQKMNKYIKELCELAGFDDDIIITKYRGSEEIKKKYKKFELLSTHTARRTFITLSLIKGIKPAVIMSYTGHTKFNMLKKYIKIAESFKRDEMDAAWGNNLTKII